MSAYILAIDQGTTSSRAALFDKHGSPVAISQRPFPQHFPKPGWVEHDPDELWGSVKGSIREVLQNARIEASDIAAIGITNQRETTVLWDSKTGQPVHNAIVWQSRQSSDICDEMKAAGLERLFRSRTGLLLDSYFSGTKVTWALRNVPNCAELMKAGRLRFGTVDTWLIYKLTGGASHVTDATNASRTLMYNIIERKWDPELCGLLSIDETVLPRVCDSSGQVALTSPEEFFGKRVPITGIAGDQQAALFGQLCNNPGEVKSTYGTGCFMLMNTGKEPFWSKNGLLTTVACAIKGEFSYALEGSIFVAGSAVQWIRDGLGIVESSSDTDSMASSLSSNDGVYFVPAFVGLGTPYWNQDVRGTITGLTRGTTRSHIARATLESIAYQTRDVLEAMVRDCSIKPKSVKVDGGMVKNDFFLSFLSDINGIEVMRPSNQETTALGAAYLAGLGSGIWGSLSELRQSWKLDRAFKPQMSQESADELYKGWKRSVRAALAATRED